jgi:type IV fimbrial biogenesis protein FimT
MTIARPNQHQQGLTLLELIIVLSIAAVLLAIGIPNLFTLLDKHRLDSVSLQLVRAVHVTRSEALQHGETFVLLPLQQEDWSRGWRVIRATEMRSNDPDQTATVLRHPIPLAQVTIKTRFTDNDVPYIAYNANGRPQTKYHTPQQAVWLIHLHQQQRIVKIGINGRPSICNPAVTPDTCQFTLTAQ